MKTKQNEVAEVQGHTPGPWHAQGRFVCEEHNRTVAEVFFDGSRGGDKLKDANARLIAAAPAMLEALKGCADMLVESAKQHRLDGSGNGHGQMCDAHADQARAAIKQAEGK